MGSSFEDKSTKIVVIESSGAVRQLLGDVLKQKGFTNIQGVGDIKSAIGILEVECVDWILTPIFDEQVPNALQLLSMITKYSELKNTKISLFLNEEELEVIPLAFEKGMMCHFEKPFNKDSLGKAMDEFLAKFEEVSWDATKLSSHFLRAYLTEKTEYDSLVSLEKGLMKCYPGEAGYLLNLAKPQFELGKKDEAKCALKQAKIVDASLTEKVDELAEQLFGAEDGALKDIQSDEATFNVLGIDVVSIIDSDDAFRKSLVSALEQLGATEVREFEEGEGAWTWIHINKEPSIIIMEWRIPKVTGPLLIQRIRSKFPCAPIVVVSSLVKEEDEPLLREMGVAAIIPKPFKNEDFISKVVQIIQKDRMPSDAESLEDKIGQLLGADKLEEAQEMRLKFDELSGVPIHRRKKIEAEFAYAEGDYEKARDNALEAVKGHSDSVMLLNLLGKCLMKLKDFVSAQKCFDKAQQMSPMNIQRLCDIAKLSQEMGDDEAADTALDKAKEIDEGSEAVAETESEVKISQGKTAEAKEIMTQLNTLSNVVSYMNNKAVAFAHNQQLQESIDLYRKTLDAIPEKQTSIIASVTYNLALAHVRNSKLDDALVDLEVASKLDNKKVTEKSESLIRRIKRSQEKGVPFKLREQINKPDANQQDGEEKSEREVNEEKAKEKAAEKARQKEKEAQAGEHLSVVATMQANPGDICCFKIFANTSPVSSKVQQLDSHPIPRFVMREAISRNEAAGLEKMMQRKT